MATAARPFGIHAIHFTRPPAVSLEVREVSVLWSAGNHAAPKERHEGAQRQTPGAVLWAVRAARPNLCQQPSQHCKIVVRSRRDGRGKLRVCGTGCTRQQHSAPPREYLLAFKDIDMKRAEESLALIGERTSSTPLNFALGTAQRRPNCRARILSRGLDQMRAWFDGNCGAYRCADRPLPRSLLGSPRPSDVGAGGRAAIAKGRSKQTERAELTGRAHLGWPRRFLVL